MEREMALGFLNQLFGAAGVSPLGNNVTLAEFSNRPVTSQHAAGLLLCCGGQDDADDHLQREPGVRTPAASASCRAASSRATPAVASVGRRWRTRKRTRWPAVADADGRGGAAPRRRGRRDRRRYGAWASSSRTRRRAGSVTGVGALDTSSLRFELGVDAQRRESAAHDRTTTTTTGPRPAIAGLAGVAPGRTGARCASLHGRVPVLVESVGRVVVGRHGRRQRPRPGHRLVPLPHRQEHPRRRPGPPAPEPAPETTPTPNRANIRGANYYGATIREEDPC